MPLQAPMLDDRKWEQIVAETRNLIPRYAPEWTDHNESDPGITLIELFAWMTEMMLYRLNQVPEKNHIEFLKLLGIELKQGQPATAELTFTLARDDISTVIVPMRTQVAAAGPGEPLIFETDEALVALGAKLAAIQSFDGFSYSIETKKNEAADQSYHPFGVYAREGAALLLGFSSPLPFPSEQINLAVEVFTEDMISEGRHCDLDFTSSPPPAKLVWEYWSGSAWEPASLDKDDTRAFTRSGHLYFRIPPNRIRRDRIGQVPENLYWIRARLERGTYDRAPRLRAVMTNTVSATQAQTVRDEVVGGSTGRANQVFTLVHKPLVVRRQAEEVKTDGRLVRITSLRLEINEQADPNVFELWEEVADFYGSGREDRHYVLNRATGEIFFGDGERGRIPLANPENPNANIVAREYRFGGTDRGNAGPDTINDLQTSVDFVESVTNRRPAIGGTAEETVAEAKLRAPRELKNKERAVTAEDFETIARDTPGARVRRAKALPLTHPKFEGARVPGLVTVIVVPESDSPAPTPSEPTLRLICAHLNKHRLLTSEVWVAPPRYRKVEIRAPLIVKATHDLAAVKREAEEELTRYFHPLHGGELGQGWPFGQEIFYSDVYRTILQVPGVMRIRENQLEIWLDGEPQTFCRDVPINPGELLFSTGHRIDVAYDEQS